MIKAFITIGGRKVVVVNGQPYYQSTGLNSDMKDCWIPFVMFKGKENLATYNLAAFPNIYHYSRLDYQLHRPTEIKAAPDYLIKIEENSLRDTIVDRQGLYADKEPSTPKDKLIKKRLITKEFLIISAQLSPEFYSDEELKKAGLNDDEIKLAHTPITLEPSDSKQSLNEWLEEQGVKYISESLTTGKRLSDAIINGKTEELTAILTLYPDSLYHRPLGSTSLLCLAISHQQDDVIELLIHKGLTLDTQEVEQKIFGEPKATLYDYFLNTLNNNKIADAKKIISYYPHFQRRMSKQVNKDIVFDILEIAHQKNLNFFSIIYRLNLEIEGNYSNNVQEKIWPLINKNDITKFIQAEGVDKAQVLLDYFFHQKESIAKTIMKYAEAHINDSNFNMTLASLALLEKNADTNFSTVFLKSYIKKLIETNNLVDLSALLKQKPKLFQSIYQSYPNKNLIEFLYVSSPQVTDMLTVLHELKLEVPREMSEKMIARAKDEFKSAQKEKKAEVIQKIIQYYPELNSLAPKEVKIMEAPLIHFENNESMLNNLKDIYKKLNAQFVTVFTDLKLGSKEKAQDIFDSPAALKFIKDNLSSFKTDAMIKYKDSELLAIIDARDLINQIKSGNKSKPVDLSKLNQHIKALTKVPTSIFKISKSDTLELLIDIHNNLEKTFNVLLKVGGKV